MYLGGVDVRVHTHIFIDQCHVCLFSHVKFSLRVSMRDYFNSEIFPVYIQYKESMLTIEQCCSTSTER